MPKLDTLKTDVKKTPKRYLLGVNFDFEADDNNPLGPHIALTTGAGAASGMNQAYLFKSLDRHSDNNDVVVDKTIIAGSQLEDTPAQAESNEMDEKVLKQLQDELKVLKSERDELNKKLKAEGISKSLTKYTFDEEIMKGVSDAMVGLTDEQVAVIISAFDLIKAKADEDLNKALDEKKGEENPLKKALEDEVGTAEADVDNVGGVVEKKSLKDASREAKEKYNI